MYYRERGGNGDGKYLESENTLDRIKMKHDLNQFQAGYY